MWENRFLLLKSLSLWLIPVNRNHSHLSSSICWTPGVIFSLHSTFLCIWKCEPLKLVGIMTDFLVPCTSSHFAWAVVPQRPARLVDQLAVSQSASDIHRTTTALCFSESKNQQFNNCSFPTWTPLVPGPVELALTPEQTWQTSSRWGPCPLHRDSALQV